MNAHPFGWREIVSIIVPVDVGLAVLVVHLDEARGLHLVSIRAGQDVVGHLARVPNAEA